MKRKKSLCASASEPGLRYSVTVRTQRSDVVGRLASITIDNESLTTGQSAPVRGPLRLSSFSMTDSCLIERRMRARQIEIEMIVSCWTSSYWVSDCQPNQKEAFDVKG